MQIILAGVFSIISFRLASLSTDGPESADLSTVRMVTVADGDFEFACVQFLGVPGLCSGEIGTAQLYDPFSVAPANGDSDTCFPSCVNTLQNFPGSFFGRDSLAAVTSHTLSGIPKRKEASCQVLLDN